MTNGNEPINPLKDSAVFDHNGLTKREYFAAMALQGLLSNPSQINYMSFEIVVSRAVNSADALIEELNK